MAAILPKEQNATWGQLRGDWVKEVEQPTTEIDWARLQPFDEWRSTRKSDRIYRGEAATEEIVALKARRLIQREERGLPGFASCDAALNEAFSATIPSFHFMGPGNAKTPAQRGVPVHSGTPQENAHIVGNALRMMGAATVGFIELEENTTRKLIYRQEVDPNRSFDFEEVEVGYETDTRLVIPNKARWVVVYTVRMSGEDLGQAPSLLSRASTMQAYTRLFTIYNQLHEFIRGLGYHSYGAASYNGFGPYPAFAVLAGLGESCRMDCVITPEYGPMVRLAALATDLPLAVTRPISFGVAEYCAKCTICADVCPVNSISRGEPTWEVQGPWSNPGHKSYYRQAMRCRDYFYQSGSNCGYCFTRCPFSQPDQEKYREFVSHLREAADGSRPMAPPLPIKRDPAGWWNGADHPELGLKRP